MCKTVIDLAHGFGSVAVAVGIEKASEALALVSMGCDYGQGFLLGQPMPEDRFVSLLRQRAASRGRKLGADRPIAVRRDAQRIAVRANSETNAKSSVIQGGSDAERGIA